MGDNEGISHSVAKEECLVSQKIVPPACLSQCPESRVGKCSFGPNHATNV